MRVNLSSVFVHILRDLTQQSQTEISKLLNLECKKKLFSWLLGRGAGDGRRGSGG